MRAILDAISKRLFLITVMSVLLFSVTANAAVSPLEMMATVKVYAIPLIFVWEYLVGKSKFKSNSTIDLVLAGAMKILGISQDDLKV